MATPTTATPAGSPSPPDQSFDTVLRGYERRQVDDFVSRLKSELAQAKDELADAQRKRRLANEHAEATERELRDLRAKSAHSEPRSVEDSFGYRAEKLLRIAEQEAAEVRTHASRESAAIIEQARTEAEKHRHEVEQSLIARAAVLEQQAAQRNAELQEREQQIADQLSAAHEQADQLLVLLPALEGVVRGVDHDDAGAGAHGGDEVVLRRLAPARAVVVQHQRAVLLAEVRRRRDDTEVKGALLELGRAARRDDVNLMPLLVDCALAYCTVGEMVGVLKDEWGEFRQPAVF
mgnify:CR=1 FL=1